MDNFNFCAYTEFVFGKDTENKCGEMCRKYGANKVLVIIGGGSVRRSGLLDRVETSLQVANLPYSILEGVKPNPEDDKVRLGLKLVAEEGFDFLLAVGGGSVIDTAKGIAAGALYDGDFWDFYCGKATPKVAMPIGVVLTIPAAGSEGSGNTVITNRETKAKISIRCAEYLRPKFSILNPVLTFTLPASQTAAGICDMMAHILERYFSNTEHTTVTDNFNEALLKSIMAEAPLVMANPEDYQARANIMWAGMLAHNGLGSVGQAEDWCSHAIEHELSALYDVTHGAGLAVVFPAWIKCVGEINPAKAVKLAVNVFGVDATLPEQEIIAEGVARLKAFWKSLGLPANLAELGVANPDIDALVAGLHRNKGEQVGAYVKVDRVLSRKIYEMCMK